MHDRRAMIQKTGAVLRGLTAAEAVRQQVTADVQEGRVSPEVAAQIARGMRRLLRTYRGLLAQEIEAWGSLKRAGGPSRDERKAANGFLPTPATLRRYGLTDKAFRAMFTAQGGACRICRLPFAVDRQVKIDHDHRDPTRRVRGLLCRDCNTALGMFRDSPPAMRTAMAYLTTRPPLYRRHRTP
jgi:hypothetical protein